MATARDDFELRMAKSTMSSLSRSYWHKRVVRPLHDQRWNSYLAKPVKVVCAKAAPSVLAAAQLPESGARAWFSNRKHDLVERLFDRQFGMTY